MPDSPVSQSETSGVEHAVTYEDCLTGSRKRELWPNAVEATARYKALSKTAFALDVRVEPVRHD